MRRSVIAARKHVIDPAGLVLARLARHCAFKPAELRRAPRDDLSREHSRGLTPSGQLSATAVILPSTTVTSMRSPRRSIVAGSGSPSRSVTRTEQPCWLAMRPLPPRRSSRRACSRRTGPPRASTGPGTSRVRRTGSSSSSPGLVRVAAAGEGDDYQRRLRCDPSSGQPIPLRDRVHRRRLI